MIISGGFVDEREWEDQGTEEIELWGHTGLTILSTQRVYTVGGLRSIATILYYRGVVSIRRDPVGGPRLGELVLCRVSGAYCYGWGVTRYEELCKYTITSIYLIQYPVRINATDKTTIIKPNFPQHLNINMEMDIFLDYFISTIYIVK